MNLKQFCIDTLALLENSGHNHGKIYVEKSMELYYWKNSLKFGVFSTMHHNLFQDILNSLNHVLTEEEWEEKFKHEHNFRKFIKAYL